MATAEHALAAVGVRPQDEDLYRMLLEHPGASLDDLARHTGASAATLRGAVARLEALGLVGRLPGRSSRFEPAPPDAAIAALIRAREQALERAALAAVEYGSLARGAPPPDGQDGVEVVRGRRAVVQRFLQLQQGAREEMLVFDQPPYVTPSNTSEPRALRRGVRYRAIYAAAALEAPGGLDRVRGSVAAGEQARVLPVLPTKLAVADRSVALAPLSAAAGRLTDSAAVLRAPALVGALVVLFELLWAQAAPVPGLTPGTQDNGQREPVAPRVRPAPLDPGDERVLALLAAGLKDEAIARQLGVSSRTVRRRARRLLQSLGAGTRFQAGMQAARRGLV